MPVPLGIRSSAMSGRTPSPVVPGAVAVGMGVALGAVVPALELGAVLPVEPGVDPVELGMVVSVLRLRQPAIKQALRARIMAIAINLRITSSC